MKRSLTLLLALALCLGLTACHRYLPETSSNPAAPPETVNEPELPGTTEPETLNIDALNVEFVAGSRDVDELVALQKAFPKALITALAKHNVNVGEVKVTFGTSDVATAEALQSGAVDVGFLAIGTIMGGTLLPLGVEQHDAPDLSLTVIAQSGTLPLELTRALPESLPELTSALSHYTGTEQGGVFVRCTEELLNNFQRLYDTGEAVLHTENVVLADLTLTLRGVGKQVNDYACGIRTIEVWNGDELLQTIEMTEAADDPGGGLDEYTSCPEAGRLFRTVDANFDGYDDIEVFGWVPNNTIPYFYWLWNSETQQYAYSFRLQGPTIDPVSRTLTAEYRESAAEYYRDVYMWQDGALVLLSHEQVTE